MVVDVPRIQRHAAGGARHRRQCSAFNYPITRYLDRDCAGNLLAARELTLAGALTNSRLYGDGALVADAKLLRFCQKTVTLLSS
jgi:hypothetical protein